MDEDEKEMLAEARARLANTKGKKAKRKARERQLEESRRLSALQKRRELKAAGIESKLGGQRKRKYIDYAREIPFQMLTPAGFYDVSEENEIGRGRKLDPLKDGLELAKMEGRHEREEEERERQRDKKRLKMLFKANAEQAIMQISKISDPSTLRRRTALALPAPQVQL
jgi:pre-mRNA-splicing factor CDC5/CEF1